MPGPAQRGQHSRQRLGGGTPLVGLPVPPPQQFRHLLPRILQFGTRPLLAGRCDAVRRDAEHLVHGLFGVVHRFQDLADDGEGEAADVQQRPDQAQPALMPGAVVRLVRAGQLPCRQKPFT
ncbi:hypothetical protein QF048_006162 [Streptomyces sp. W4I9-2]|nr:hypothetical protein [Streptomyces sp. W4I9-2]